MSTGVEVVLDTWIHNPKRDGQLISAQQINKFIPWLQDLCAKWGFMHSYQPMRFYIDCANTEMIHQMRALKYEVISFTNKKTAESIHQLNAGFGSNNLYLLQTVNNDQLAQELESNTFINGKLDSKIPNDIFDALRYGIYGYDSNPKRYNTVRKNINEE